MRRFAAGLAVAVAVFAVFTLVAHVLGLGALWGWLVGGLLATIFVDVIQDLLSRGRRR